MFFLQDEIFPGARRNSRLLSRALRFWWLGLPLFFIYSFSQLPFPIISIPKNQTPTNVPRTCFCFMDDYHTIRNENGVKTLTPHPLVTTSNHHVLFLSESLYWIFPINSCTTITFVSQLVCKKHFSIGFCENCPEQSNPSADMPPQLAIIRSRAPCHDKQISIAPIIEP